MCSAGSLTVSWHMISFDIADFKDAVRNLKLLPKTIRSPHRHKGSRALCIYILMWCWTGMRYVRVLRWSLLLCY